MSNLCLERQGGLGDLLMALGAAKALNAIDNRMTINTSPRYLHVAAMCPSVLAVTHEPKFGIDLGSVTFGSAQEHQIDAYLRYFGFDPTSIPAENKQIEYEYPHIELQGLSDYVICHPGVYECGNRGYGRAYWQRVVTALKEDGQNVVVIGSHSHCGVDTQPFEDTAGTIKCDNVLESTGIISRAKALISIDSGPIQMAGATNTPIIGLYSVTRPEFRLPFRHGVLGWNAIGLTNPCPEYPCYKSILGGKAWEGVKTVEDVNNLYANWCPVGDERPRCLEVKPSLILSALHNLTEK